MAEAAILWLALARKQWELAALCLLLGLAQALAEVPQDSVEGMMDVLNGGSDEDSSRPSPP